MPRVILFHFLCTQHISDINISIIRNLRLYSWINTSVVLFSARCVLEIWCCWVWTVSILQAEACNMDTIQTQPHEISNTQRTENKTTDVVIQQHSRKLLMMDILMSEICWVHKKWNKITRDIKLVFYSSRPRIVQYLRLHYALTCNESTAYNHQATFSCVSSCLALQFQDCPHWYSAFYRN